MTASPRRPVVQAALIVALGLLAIAVLGAPHLRAPRRVSFLLLNVGRLPWRGEDHAALAALLPDARRAGDLDRAAMLRELKALTGDAVVYLSAPARKDPSGHACVLPADADPDDPTTWLPLSRIDGLLGPRRLLLLDLDGETGEPCAGPTLHAAAPGQTPLWSEYRGRTTFGHYVERGLSGAADLDGDSRVTGRELAAFVRDRTDRWARRVRGARQTPEFGGTGDDFALVEARRPEAAEYPEARAYPIWLTRADEPAWREGADPRTLKARKPDPLPLAEHTPKAVTPTAESVEAVRRFARGKTSPAAFLQRNEPSPDLSAACVAVVTEDPTTLPAVAALLAAAEPRPASPEALAVARLAALDYPAPLVKRVLEAVRDGERAALDPRGFARFRDEAERAARLRHDAFVLLESRGYAPPAEVGRVVAEAHAASARLLARRDALRPAHDALEVARRLLPEARAYLRAAGRSDPHWRRAVAAMHALIDGDEDAEALRKALDALEEPFRPDGLARRIAAAKAAESPGAWRELEGLLAAGRLADRAAVWQAARDLGRRLEQATDALDQRDGPKLAGVPPAEAAQEPTFREVPAVPADGSLRAWLADRYRYEARAADEGSAASEFYARAAAEYRPWLTTREASVDLVEMHDGASSKQLIPDEPNARVVLVHPRPAGRVEVKLLNPDDAWLGIDPPLLITEDVAPFRLTPRPAKGPRGDAPSGVLVWAKHAGRTFHRRVNVSFSSPPVAERPPARGLTDRALERLCTGLAALAETKPAAPAAPPAVVKLVSFTDVPRPAPKSSVGGRVVEGDRPQPGLVVILRDAGGVERAKATTDAEGGFAFPDVPPGRYRLSVTKPASRRGAEHPREPGTTFEVAPGASVTVPLRLYL